MTFGIGDERTDLHPFPVCPPVRHPRPLRAHLPHARSLLMDRATLLQFEAHWGVEERPTRRDLQRLNAPERALYEELRDNRLRPNLRLEQERIGFGWVERAVAGLAGGPI